MQETKRVFIAIELTPEIHQTLTQLISRLKSCGDESLRWVKPENIHLTLKFLGETPVQKLSAISTALEHSLSQYEAFLLTIKGTGCFPNASHPRVLWTGVALPTTLAEMQRGIDHALFTIGFAAEKNPFSPHLTLARVSDQNNDGIALNTVQELNSYRDTVFGQMQTDHVTLFQSVLARQGSIYIPLARFPLKSREI